MNNKILTKIAELNMEQERGKLDLSQIWPDFETMEMFSYELTRINDKTTPFTYNSNENTINIAGVANERKTTFYMESESKTLFSPKGTQIELGDIKSVIGYIDIDLDWANKSYIISPVPFSEGNDLKQIYMITLTKQYDNFNDPKIHRVEVQNIVQALNENYKNRIVLKNVVEFLTEQEIKDGTTVENTSIEKIEIKFSNNGGGLCALDVYDDRTSLPFFSESNYAGVPVIPFEITGKNTNIYLPTFDTQSVFKDLPNLKYGFKHLITEPLNDLLMNLLAIGQMMIRNFEGVKEDGFAPGKPHTIIKPSAGWFWKTALEKKDPKGAAAVIQNYINNAITLIENNEHFSTDINTLAPYGTVVPSGGTIPSAIQYEKFYSLLSMFSQQLFSNYSYNYGGTFDSQAVFPTSLSIPYSSFSVSTAGSEMLKLDNFLLLKHKNNWLNKTGHTQKDITNSQLSKIDTFWADETATTIKSMGLYVIDYKYAYYIAAAASRNTNWRDFQNKMISSPGAVKIGVEPDAVFINGGSWSSTKRVGTTVHIPESVFKNMENPVFYHASLEHEIARNAYELTTDLNHNQASFESLNNYHRGFPKVPFASEIKSYLKKHSKGTLIYTCNLESQFNDDVGAANDYAFGVQNFKYTISNIQIDDNNQNQRFFETGVNVVKTLGGKIPLMKPGKQLIKRDIAKTLGENTKNIIDAPNVFLNFGTVDDYMRFLDYDKKPYVTLSDMFGQFNMKYTMKPNGIYDNLTALQLSFIGNDNLEITVEFSYNKVKKDGTKTYVTSTFPLHTKSKTLTGLFDNQLYLEPSENFLDTYALINLGDE